MGFSAISFLVYKSSLHFIDTNSLLNVWLLFTNFILLFNEQKILTLMSNLPVLSFLSWLRKFCVFFAYSKVMKMFFFASFLKSYFCKPFTFRCKVYLELTSVYSVRSQEWFFFIWISGWLAPLLKWPSFPCNNDLIFVINRGIDYFWVYF